ncbi:hypothetical protein HYC85_014179 [Camellia sinensis]|uniref:Uncharacterized protein n=1 Tax=Camellia sinensis TaxID=4442 RepID=A0A7J7H5H7_CAMSI|nr:hypothetical protein HYC85_014179 [Camellia sinensis]
MVLLSTTISPSPTLLWWLGFWSNLVVGWGSKRLGRKRKRANRYGEVCRSGYEEYGKGFEVVKKGGG